MRRLRVVHCIYDDPSNPWLGGGGAHRVQEIYERLTEELEVTVIAGAYPGCRSGPRRGVRWEHLGVRRPYALSRLSYGRAATALLRRGEFDAAYFDFSVYTPIRVPASGHVGHVVHMPIGPTARRRWGRLVGEVVAWREARMLSRATRVQTTSEWMRERLRPRVAAGAEIRVVRSGVDASFHDVVRREGGHVLFYGRFDMFQKGLDLLLDVAPRLLAARPGTRLILAGRGKDEGELRRRVRGSGLYDRVEVRADPERGEVQRLMAGALCLLHPSRFEGLPVVPAEAMAAGVPVVATDVGAVREVLGDPPGGVLIPPEDPGALEAAARRLLEDDPRRARLSARARESARRFSWDRVAAEHLSHVRSLAE